MPGWHLAATLTTQSAERWEREWVREHSYVWNGSHLACGGFSEGGREAYIFERYLEDELQGREKKEQMEI